MVSGMHFKISDNLPAVNQYLFSKKKQEFITAEIKTLLAKSVIVETKHEPRKFISPTFFVKNLMVVSYSVL